MRRSAPRPLASALERVAASAAPATTLARVQRCWPAAAGERLAREAEPVSERDGVVTLRCRSATWANELELLSGDLAARLNQLIEPQPGDTRVSRLRFITRSGGRS